MVLHTSSSSFVMLPGNETVLSIKLPGATVPDRVQAQGLDPEGLLMFAVEHDGR